ncbi:hypothetical protein D1007_53573 [Hordeum vulgare]|nr:hypothetical protein D1007_53573 [Hordeum vulgare]
MFPLVASNINDGQASDICPGSPAPSSLVKTTYPFFLHNMYAKMVPPFSGSFYAILSYYQIQALHLQPNSVLLLAIFTFYYEAFVGVRPSMALFHHFFTLRFTTPGQHSARVSFVDVRRRALTQRPRRRWKSNDTTRSHRGSSIVVSSSHEDRSDQDSEVIEREEDAGQIPPPNLHLSLHNLGDDIATDGRR